MSINIINIIKITHKRPYKKSKIHSNSDIKESSAEFNQFNLYPVRKNMSLFYVCAPFILTTEPEIEEKQLHDSVYKYSLREGYYSSAQHVHIF